MSFFGILHFLLLTHTKKLSTSKDSSKSRWDIRGMLAKYRR